MRNLFIAYALILCLTVSIAETAVTEIYVSNKVALKNPDGSENTPYQNISSALNRLKALSSDETQVVIKIDPSSTTYNLYSIEFSLASTNSLNLTITQWKRTETSTSIDSNVILDLVNTTMSFSSLSLLNLEGILIQSQNSSITVRESGFTLYEVINILPLESKTPFIRLIDCKYVYLDDILLSTFEQGTFLEYQQTRKDLVPQLVLWNITATIYPDENKSTASSVLFNLNGNGAVSEAFVEILQFEVKPIGAINFDKESLIKVEGFQNVTLQNVTIKGQSLSTSNPFKVARVRGAEKLKVGPINFRDNQVNISSASSLFLFEEIGSLKISDLDISRNNITAASGSVFKLIETHNVGKIKHNDNILADNAFDGNVQIITVSESANSPPHNATSVQITNLILINNTNVKSRNQFSYMFFQEQLLDLNITTVEYQSNQLSGRVFSFKSKVPSVRNLTEVTRLYLHNINIQGNQGARDLGFLYFLPFDDSANSNNCLDLLEAYSLEITDLKIWNNTFAQKGNDLWSYKVALFQITQTQVYVTNAIIASNTFERYDIISLDQKHSTITFNSSMVDENVFVSSSLINTRYQAVNEFCLPSQERFGSTTLILYRYSFILNTDFNAIQLHSSTLFNLNNAFLLLKNNEFSDMLLIDSSLLSTSVSPMTLLPGTNAYHRNSTLESLVFKNKEENWNIFNDTVLLVESKKDQSVHFYVWKENVLLNLTIIDSSRLVSLTGYGFEQSSIQFAGNQFLEMQSSEELSTMIYVESFANLTISENIVYGANGGAVLFSLPHAKESAALQINSNQVANSKIAAFSLYSGKSIQGVEIHNNTVEYVRFYVAFVSVRSEIVSGPWKVTSNAFNKCAMIAESSLSGSENFAVLSFSNKIAYDKAQVLFRDNLFDSMNLGSLLSSTENLKIDFISIQCPQNVNFINVTFANFTFYSQGALISAKDMKELSIQSSQFKSLSANNLNGLIAISSQTILVVRSSFNSIVNREGKGIFSLKNSFANQGVQIIDTAFDTVESDLEGAVFSVRALESDVTSGSVNITLKITGCQMHNIVSGNAIQLNTVNCVGCAFKDTFLNLSSKVAKNFVNIVGGSIGSLEVSNIVFATESSLKYPFLGISNSAFEVNIKNTQFDGSGVNEFYLAALDSGTLEVTYSTFENIVLRERALISVVPTSQTLRHYVDDASFFPNVIFGSTIFRNISNANRKPYWNDAETTAALTYPIPDLLPENEQLRRGLDSEYVDSPFVPAVLFSVIPFGFYSQETVFEGLSLLPGILIGSAPSWTQEFSRAQSQLMINATTFRGNQYLFGPALNVLPKALTTRITITNSNFANNTAFVGGAMSVYGAYLTISESLIKDNHASLIGAAVLTGTTTIIKTTVTKVDFENNTAFYPGDVRSAATDFKLDFIPAASSSIKVGEEKANGQRKLVLLNASLEEFKAGHLELNFIDFQGNPAPYFSPISKFNAEIASNRPYGLQSYFTSALNQKVVTGANLTTRDLNIAGKAFDKVDVVFKFSFWNMLRDKTMTVSLRPCANGEYNNSLSCESCPAGMFTFDPSQRCTECPENAKCSSKAQIVPYPGYWNAHPGSAVILQCRADDLQRCTNEDNARSCAAGYAGPLCEACDFDNSFVENGYLKCAKCKDPKMSLIYTAVIGLLYFAYQLFSIKAISASNEQSSLDQQTSLMAFRKIERSYYIKSLLTYTQLMSILFMGNSYIYQLIGVTAQLGNPSSLVMYGTQCSLKALGIEPANFLYYQTYLSVFSPIVQLLLILVILLIVKGVSSSVSVGKFFMTACVYYLVSYQPGLVLSLMQFRSCTTLKGVDSSFLTAHPNWTCDSEQYAFTSKFVVSPALICWCIVLPLFILIALLIKKSRNQEQEAKGSYGMLFFDLNSKFHYWGLILMLLKLSLSFLIFGLDKSVELQICLSLMLLWAYQSFVKWLSPYKTESFNRLEVLLMNLLMFNIILAKYLLNPANGFAISEGALIVGVALNGLFLIGLLWKVISLSFLNVVSTVEKSLLDRGDSVDNRHLLNDSNAIL